MNNHDIIILKRDTVGPLRIGDQAVDAFYINKVTYLDGFGEAAECARTCKRKSHATWRARIHADMGNSPTGGVLVFEVRRYPICRTLPRNRVNLSLTRSPSSSSSSACHYIIPPLEVFTVETAKMDTLCQLVASLESTDDWMNVTIPTAVDPSPHPPPKQRL